MHCGMKGSACPKMGHKGQGGVDVFKKWTCCSQKGLAYATSGQDGVDKSKNGTIWGQKGWWVQKWDMLCPEGQGVSLYIQIEMHCGWDESRRIISE